MISSQVLYHRIDYLKTCTNISGIQMFILFRVCGSLFVGHCRSDLLVEHFNKLATDMRWDSSYLLYLGMDGPNSMKFQNDLKTRFKESYDKGFLNIDMCTPFKFGTLFKNGVFQLPININNVTVNLHDFFKLYSAKWWRL